MLKPCSNVNCPNLIERGQRYCPGCAPASRWGDKGLGSNRTGTKAHKSRRKRILTRDPMCQLRLPGCTATSTVLDHIVPLKAAGITGLTAAQLDSDVNCRGICQRCSDKVSSQQAHYLAGHKVDCPWTDADVERLRVTEDSSTPRAIWIGGDAHASGDHEQRGSQAW